MDNQEGKAFVERRCSLCGKVEKVEVWVRDPDVDPRTSPPAEEGVYICRSCRNRLEAEARHRQQEGEP